MTNDELQRNAIAISRVIFILGASSEFSKCVETIKSSRGCDGICCSHTVIPNES